MNIFRARTISQQRKIIKDLFEKLDDLRSFYDKTLRINVAISDDDKSFLTSTLYTLIPKTEEHLAQIVMGLSQGKNPMTYRRNLLKTERYIKRTWASIQLEKQLGTTKFKQKFSEKTQK